VATQPRDRYCAGLVRRTITLMNTSTTNPTIQTTDVTGTSRRPGMLRAAMAGALIAAGISATALGVATAGHADTGAQAPNTHVGTTAPGKAVPAPPSIDGFGRGMPGYHPTPHHRHRR
jgi:hypothetical protein